MSVTFKHWRGVSTTLIILTIAASSLPSAHFMPRASALALYNSGNPTADEQLVLEYINRARAGPFAEGQRLGIDIHEGLQNPSLVGPRPPLAMNSMLLGISEAHSRDMYNGNYFSHTDPNGTSPFDRMIHAGYDYVRAGEDMAAGTGLSATELEDLMMVDSGTSGRPHRLNLLDLFNSYPCTGPCVYTEVGVGYYQGFITEDFGNTGSTGPFLLGVVYDDRNGNNFYDIVEGMAGVTITPSTGAYYGVSSSSGGYAIPIGTSGTITVTASGPGFGPISKTITLTGANVKLDFTPQSGATTVSQSTTQATPTSTTQTSSQTTQTSSSATAQTFFEQSLLESVTFETMPASFVGTVSPGTINACGSTFTNSQSGPNCPTSFTATANLPTPSAGWAFDHWEWTGGVTCSSSTANPVSCSASNSGGVLMAVYAAQVSILTNPASNAVVSLGSCSNPGYRNGAAFFSPIYGQAVVTACNLPAGYSFSSWTCSGGLACSSSTNPTTVTFGGPGTITMNLQAQTTIQTSIASSTFSDTSQSTSSSLTVTTAQSAPEFYDQTMTIFALLVVASLIFTRGKRLSNGRRQLR